ncbi:MAG: DUF2851 family protein [Rikenellaceae bacterium]
MFDIFGRVDDPEKEQKRALNRLVAGSSFFGCGRYLKSIDEIHRQEIYAHYEFERLEGKYQTIMDFYHNDAGENWNQTLFSYFFQYLGDPKNKETYKLLAKRVGYSTILRERSNPLRIEALLLGAAGLLKDYDDDLYTQSLRREAEYLMRKYNITPLSSKQWNMNKQYPKNSPVLRLAQAATLFSQNELLFDKIIRCRCAEDIEDIFSVEASDYWTTHYVPSRVSAKDVKRIGADKCNILGINVVVMLQYAYGSYISDDELVDQAQNLIQDLKAETNWITTKWRNHGLRPKTAFEGQALIQLGGVHCAEGRCKGCFVGARAMQNFSWLDSKE